MPPPDKSIPSTTKQLCGIKLKDRFPSKELRERQGIDDIALVLQQNRLHWYGHVLRKDDDDWLKKCMEHEARDREWQWHQLGHMQVCTSLQTD